ncbi:MAG: pallilysin-related adhesin, partial [Spirochaetaceae bacterium]|nr:pallilysin-related adhesin [Spirochaetaceae bacterium]
ATALARIQDGTVETFESFLNGLWYKLTPTGEPQYLFFNPEEKELVLLVNNTQEVYDWASSVLRRNGIYLATSNKSITTLKKRFDITLTALDEIKLKINEDVQMKISADSTWDGDYRKIGKAVMPSGENRSWEEFAAALQNSGDVWLSPDGTELSFTRDRYSVSRHSDEDSGMYTLIRANNIPAIQFRSLRGGKLFENSYRISFPEEQGADNSVKEILMLRPVKISTHGMESIIGESFVFERLNRGS